MNLRLSVYSEQQHRKSMSGIPLTTSFLHWYSHIQTDLTASAYFRCIASIELEYLVSSIFLSQPSTKSNVSRSMRPTRSHDRPESSHLMRYEYLFDWVVFDQWGMLEVGLRC